MNRSIDRRRHLLLYAAVLWTASLTTAHARSVHPLPAASMRASAQSAAASAPSASSAGTAAGSAASSPKASDPEPISRALLRDLTAQPRLAGTSGSRWSAELTAAWLEDAGWRVEIDEREVMLSLPRSITFTVFDNSFSDKPTIEHIDRFDPDAIPPGDLPKCNGWSASGDVRGLVVDAGYGLRADFERLKSLGVDVRGAIALVKYGHSYRGIKVDLATQYGCSGVLLFDDPSEDGPERGATWPEGPWKPDWDAQRGSISPMGHIPGDPSTPGWASGKHGDASVKRVDKKELDEALPRIPCIPIGAGDARAIQAKLNGVETKDKDGKSKSERLGPGPVQVHLVVDQPRDLRTIYNVIARLPGQSELCVIAGAHRDAWVRGANDDGAGTVLMVRAAQELGAKARAGWKPKSSLMICLWDAEEFGMIGSTEWGEANAAWLEKNCIAYINADTGVGGPHFRGASGTPGLLGTLKDVLQRVPAARTADTEAAKTLWDEWCAGVKSRSKDKVSEPRLSLPGSGSDFAVFLHHLSVPVLQFGFGDSESGQYHTTFDDFAVVDRYIDPGFVGHELAGKFTAELLRECSERGASAFEPREAAEELSRRAREAADDIAPEPLPSAGGDGATSSGTDVVAMHVDPALEHLAQVLRNVSDKLAAYGKAEGTSSTPASIGGSSDGSSGAGSKSANDAKAAPADASKPASANDAKHPSGADGKAAFAAGGAAGGTNGSRAITFYSTLALPEGIPGRPWYRNRLWTPGLEDGYGSETFPTLRIAAKESAAALEREADSLIQAIERLSADASPADSPRAATVSRLWTFFKRFLRHKRQLIPGFLCVPLAQLGDIAITMVIGNALDRLRQGSDTEFLAGIFGIILGLSAFKGVFRYMQRWWIVAVSRYVENEMKQELFDKLVSLSFRFHSKSRSGDVVSRVTSDVENIRMFLGPGVMYTLGAIVMVPASMAILFTLNAPLALTMILPLVLMGLGMKAFTPRLHKYSEAVQESIAEIGHRAQENFSGIRIVKGYGREEQQVAKFEEASQKNLDNQIQLGRSRGLTHALTHAANDFTFVVILVIGGLSMIDRTLAAGDLFKFIDLTFKVFWPIIALGWIAGMYPRALASAKRIDELLSETSEIRESDAPRDLREVRGHLRLENVGFTYSGADRPALSSVSVDVPAGSVLGVVGPTGSGKTTLLLLLGRLFDADGTITLDGAPIRDLSLATLRGALGYVPQDSFLFSERYRDNVAFGVDGALSDERLNELVETACMKDEVATFPKGLDQLIGERGVTLSGGQRQRTCIARALAREPRVLILDDALSAVDTETESKLLENLRRAGRGRTVVIAAHRLSSVARADRILVLKKGGQVEAQGTHAELVARPGWYRETWQRQQAQSELSVL